MVRNSIVVVLMLVSNVLWAQTGPISLEARWPDGPCYSVFVSGSLAYVGNGGALDVVDISNPSTPKRIGRVVLPSVVQDLEVSGNYAYVADAGGGLRVVDVSSPDSPKEVGLIATGGDALSIVVAGTRAYVAAYAAGVVIVDISVPTQPQTICSLTVDGYANDLAVWNDTLAVAVLWSGLVYYFDVSDSSNPMEITRHALAGGFTARSLEVSGSFAYVASSPPMSELYGRLHVLDIHDLQNPLELASLSLPGDWGSAGRDVSVTDSLVVVTYSSDVGDGLVIMGIDTPSTPKELGQLWTQDARRARGDGSRIYLADGGGGLKILDMSTPSNPSAIGTYRTSDRTMDVVVVGQRAYLGCALDGIRILDLSPAVPVNLGSYNWSNRIWGDAIDVQGNYAFITSNLGCVDVVDITDPVTCFHVAMLCDVIGTAIEAKDTLLYVADRDNGLRIASIADPRQPFWLARAAEGDHTSNLTVSGSYVYVTTGSTGTRIIDVADPRKPRVITTLPTPSSSVDVAVEAQLAYVAGGNGGLQIFNVSDPYSPSLLSSTGLDGYAFKVAVSNSFAYVSLRNGICVLDVSNPSSPQRIDLVPTGDFGYEIFALADYIYVADDYDGLYVFHNSLITGTKSPTPLPTRFSLEQNYPNPFNPSTTIRYGFPQRSAVHLAVYNTLGQKVAILVEGEQEAGYHEVRLDGSGLASGVYFYRLTAGSYVAAKKFLLLR